MQHDNCSLHEWHILDSLPACRRRWTRRKMILMEYCSSGLHLQKSCSNHGQTHRGNAIVETPCRSPAEFAILLPNISIPVVDPKCSKAYIIQLKTCIKPDPGCTQVWNLSQMHLSTFPKGMLALLDCSGTALRWSK